MGFDGIFIVYIFLSANWNVINYVPCVACQELAVVYNAILLCELFAHFSVIFFPGLIGDVTTPTQML